MPFLFLGIFLLLLTIIFLRLAIVNKDKEGIVGMSALLLASIIMIVFFGILYSSFFQ